MAHWNGVAVIVPYFSQGEGEMHINVDLLFRLSRSFLLLYRGLWVAAWGAEG